MFHSWSSMTAKHQQHPIVPAHRPLRGPFRCSSLVTIMKQSVSISRRPPTPFLFWVVHLHLVLPKCTFELTLQDVAWDLQEVDLLDTKDAVIECVLLDFVDCDKSCLLTFEGQRKGVSSGEGYLQRLLRAIIISSNQGLHRRSKLYM